MLESVGGDRLMKWLAIALVVLVAALAAFPAWSAQPPLRRARVLPAVTFERGPREFSRLDSFGFEVQRA